MSKIYKILLVDDLAEWLKTYKNLFNQYFDYLNIELTTATSAKDGLIKILETKNFDLVITDLEMERIFDGDYAGSWLIENILAKEDFKNTKFLILSGADDIMHVANKHKVQYIPKSTLINNPLVFKLKIQEMLEILE